MKKIKNDFGKLNLDGLTEVLKELVERIEKLETVKPEVVPKKEVKKPNKKVKKEIKE